MRALKRSTALKTGKFKDFVSITADGKKIKLDNKEDSLVSPYEDQGFLLRGDLPESLDNLDVEPVQATLPGPKLTWQLSRE